MQTKRISRAIIVTMIVSGLFLTLSPTASAQTVAERKAQVEATAKAHADVKKKICANHESQVNSVMTRVVNRNQLRIDRITAIADKTKAFYAKKGIKVTNYAQLVADVDAKRVIAQSAVSTIQSIASFTCDNATPRTTIQTFRNKRAGGVEEIKAYRDSVKQLITGVKATQAAGKAATR